MLQGGGGPEVKHVIQYRYNRNACLPNAGLGRHLEFGLQGAGWLLFWNFQPSPSATYIAMMNLAPNNCQFASSAGKAKTTTFANKPKNRGVHPKVAHTVLDLNEAQEHGHIPHSICSVNKLILYDCL